MDVVLGPGGTSRETERRGEASAASPWQRTRSPPRRTTRSPERRPFRGTGDNSTRIMQELRHRMQDLERRLADREHRQQTPESSYSRSILRSRSRRTASPQSEPENAREGGRARRCRDPLIYARHDRRTTERNREDTHQEDDEGRTTRTRGPVIMGATPFHRSILEVRLPKHFDKPTDMRYDGTQDPQEHLTAFEARMNLEGVGDEVRCHAFPITLAGPAIRWFNNLPQGSVTRFSDISRAFLAQFTTRIAKAKHPINLLGVTYRSGEPTRKYLDRFNDECLEIDGLTDSVASLCLTNGLLNEDFRKYLTKKPVWTMHEIQCVVREYINDEEVSQVVAANKRQPSYNQNRHHRSGERQKEHTRDGGLSKAPRPFPRVGKFTNYTPFTAPIMEVYQQIAEKGILSKPRPLKERTRGNRSLCCDYHKGYGHKTQDCFDLKDALEEPRRRNRDHEGEDKTRAAKRCQEPEDNDHGLTIVNVVTARNVAPRSKLAHKKDAKVLAVSTSSARSPKKLPSISFGPEDQWFDKVAESPPMVITARVGTGLIKRILVVTGADSNIMFRNVFDALGLRDADLKTHQHGVVGLGDHFIKPDGIISLPTSVGQGQGRRTVMVEFVILRDSTAYNIILGRKTINDVGAVISTRMLIMKFITEEGLVGKKSKKASGVFLADLDARVSDKSRPEPEGNLEKFRVGDTEEKFTFVNRNLPHELKEPLMEMIKANGDLFAWTPADMPRIDPQLMSHHLAVKPEARPVAQRRRKMSQERAEKVAKQTASLLEAGFIWELDYSTWLLNVVLVRKHNGKLRMSVDYSDLNKACPKDCYPLPNIDALVDAAAGYRGHIPKVDEQDIRRHHWQNGGSLRGRHPCQDRPTRRPSKRPGKRVHGPSTTWHEAQPSQVRLCHGGREVPRIHDNQKGVEANPEKFQAILQMKSPGCVKDVQRLAGRLTALSRFLGASAAKALPFFNLMRKGIAFEWIPACEEAFNHFKKILATPPVLGKPVVGEPLYLYLVVTEEALAAVLVREEAKVQQPIYFVSKALQGAELRYSKLEKLALALLTSSRRLRQYFQGHQVVNGPGNSSSAPETRPSGKDDDLGHRAIPI
ncbi:uncharacterized protein [Arachis hypogaea]|uniref:uncharacterized protein n=1 Tax=Arachis hypogaea TaxID=3818 RepID=UPI003B213EAC